MKIIVFIDIPNLKNFDNLTISTTNDLQNLLNNQLRKRILKNMVINENSLNNLKTNLEISSFDNLEKILVKENSLKNLNSLKVCHNEKLNTIEIEYSAFWYVKNVIIESI